VPSGLAFGTQGAGGGVVPGNANLIYEMELLEIIHD
jgi:FKBP-type peptidyl-prolyl cis-trans isomerase